MTLDKKYQRTDWSVRPLLPGMLAYAADDTRYLPRLRDLLKERLVAAGRWHWAQEEFALLEQVRWSAAGPPEEAYLRLKGPDPPGASVRRPARAVRLARGDREPARPGAVPGTHERGHAVDREGHARR